jgi:2-polyprenyl-3-methyl-5-hydroxy-6-metoxy-1,4-benzoquinol methylase
LEVRLLENLIKYYEQQDEDGRLKMDRAHSLEYLTTIKYLDKICSGHVTVLDACAGTGAYCFYLAEKGHTVTAGDIVQSNVNIIKEKQKRNPILHDIYTGDILNLSQFKEESFDVVLCLGAFYHIHNETERKKAVLECKRVAKKGGIIVVAYLNRFASFINNFSNQPDNILEILNQFYTGNKNVFYRSTPAEIEKLMLECQVRKKYNIATDGIAFMCSKQLQSISDNEFNEYLDYHYDTCENANILGYSLHGLLIGEK